MEVVLNQYHKHTHRIETSHVDLHNVQVSDILFLLVNDMHFGELGSFYHIEYVELVQLEYQLE